MSAFDMLRALSEGEQVAGLLPACRLEHDGCDYFGQERIVAAFRRQPLAIGDTAIVVDGANHLAVVDSGNAVFADVYDGNLGRLWRVGGPGVDRPEPVVAVAFDPDLHQARGNVVWRTQDHPQLDADAHPAVLRAGTALVDDAEERSGLLRVRAFVLRAFGAANEGAALFCVHAMTSEDVRSAGFIYAVALWRGDALHLVRDTRRVGNRSAQHHVSIAR